MNNKGKGVAYDVDVKKEIKRNKYGFPVVVNEEVSKSEIIIRDDDTKKILFKIINCGV